MRADGRANLQSRKRPQFSLPEVILQLLTAKPLSLGASVELIISANFSLQILTTIYRYASTVAVFWVFTLGNHLLFAFLFCLG